MSEPGEMRPSAPERAVSERWIDELIALRVGGSTRRVPVRTRICRVQERRRPDHPLFVVELVLTLLRLGIVMYAVDKVLGRLTHPPMVETHAEIALYEVGARPGDLPVVVVDFPVRLAAAVDAQDGRVDVRGELQPGHAVVLVLDDGEIAPCQYPAEPPPPIGAKRIWAYGS